MIRPANTIERVLVYSKPVDFRKAVDGLSVIVEQTLDENPFSGTLFVFTNRQRDKVKILCWERNGFVMWYKRLEKERFLWPDKQGDTVTLNGQQLNWLLDGYDIRRLHPHQKISPLSAL